MTDRVRNSRCVVVTRFSRIQPGYLDFSYRIEALAKTYNVTLLSSFPLDVPELQIGGVNHVVLGGSRSLAGLLRYLWAAGSFIRRARPDCVILLHTLTAPLVYLLRKTPHALYWNEHAIRFRGNAREGPVKNLLGTLKYNVLFLIPTTRADLVMPIGEAHRDDLLLQGCRPERLKMIYMGVDERFSGVAMERKRASPDAPIELIYTGSVQKERGRDVMLEGVAKAAGAGVHARLTLVGAQPSEADHCQRYARELGIEHQIRIYGRVPGHEIPRYIADSDAGICIWEDRPWWRFNPPTKLFEYLVAGLPVLASNIRTHTEYVRHGENGLIFEYDSSSFAEAISTLWTKRRELPSMKQRAFESGRPYLWNSLEPVFLEAVADLVRR